MICRVVPFPTIFSDPQLWFQDHSASSIFYAWLVFMQLTRDLFAIAMFLSLIATAGLYVLFIVKVWESQDLHPAR